MTKVTAARTGCEAKEAAERQVISLFSGCFNEEGVYTQIARNCSVREFSPIIRGKADTSAVIYSDGLRTYDGLVNYGYEKYYRDQYSDTEFAAGHNHMNGIENFWGLCKVCALQSSAEYIDILSLYTSKSENLDTTTETKIFT